MSGPYRENAKPAHTHRWGYVWAERVADPLFYWGCVVCRTPAGLLRTLWMEWRWLSHRIHPFNTPSTHNVEEHLP